MKKIFTLLYMLLFCVAAQAQQSVKIDARWMKSHYSKSEYMVPMRDGEKLYTAVFAPKNKKALHPMLICRTEKGCEPYGKKVSTFWQEAIYWDYLQKEYIIIFQDVRGKGRSEGNPRPLARVAAEDGSEVTDSYDAIKWLLRKVKKNNGKVSVMGYGEDAIYALSAAACSHPAVVACVAQAPTIHVATEGVSELLKKVTTPTLFVGGAFDYKSNDNALRYYIRLKSENQELDSRVVVGPWAEGGWRKAEGGDRIADIEFAQGDVEFYRSQIEHPFIEHYLLGAEYSGASASGILAYITGENCWREIEEWSHTDSATLYLGENGSLGVSQPTDDGLHAQYSTNPQNPVPYFTEATLPLKSEALVASQTFVERREDVLTFHSSALEQDVSVMGEVVLTLYASLRAEKENFIVKLIDEGPDGEYEMLVRGVVSNGDAVYSTEGVNEIKLRFANLAHTFLAGHRVKLQIQSSLHPFIKSDSVNTIVIHHDKSHSSSLVLPIQ